MKTMIGINDYPLRNHPEIKVSTPSGIAIEDITFENLENGTVKGTDIRISKDTLLMQADIAMDAGNQHLAQNFRRAAEMVCIESDRILEIYNAMRPYRSSEEELLDIADELRTKYGAELTANFVEDAARVLKLRGKLKGDR